MSQESQESQETCICTDSACDLPQEFIRAHGIKILPIKLHVGDSEFFDTRDPAQTIRFYRRQVASKALEADTEPLSAEETTRYLEKELVRRYNDVLAITINSNRSLVFDNLNRAAFIGVQKFRKLRNEEGNTAHFRLKVIDSETMFTGQAILVHEAARLLEEERRSMIEIQTALNQLKGRVHAYLLPRDLFYLHTRASKKGDSSVSWLNYKVGSLLQVKPIVRCYHGVTEPVAKVLGFDKALDKLFDLAREQIEKGLSIPLVTMSYAGELIEIEDHHAYRSFIEYAQDKGVKTLLALMSTTGALNVGPGSFSLGFAAG